MGPAYFIVVIALQLMALASVAFWFYWLTSLYLNNTARKTQCSPGSLFASAVLIQIVLFFLIFCGIGMLVAAVPLGFVIPFSGLIGWAVLGVKRYRNRAEIRAYRSERPLPKMQCSMIDIYVGVSFFGLAMALCTAGVQATSSESMESSVFPIAVYFLLVTYLGFYASLDVLRRSPKPFGRKGRIGAIIGVMLAFSLTFVVGGLIAWRAWQKTLQTIDMEEWRKARLAVLIKEAVAEEAAKESAKPPDATAGLPST